MRLNWQDPLREPSAALIPREAMVANGTMPWGKNSTPARLHREGSTWNANSTCRTRNAYAGTTDSTLVNEDDLRPKPSPDY